VNRERLGSGLGSSRTIRHRESNRTGARRLRHSVDLNGPGSNGTVGRSARSISRAAACVTAKSPAGRPVTDHENGATPRSKR